MKWISLVLCLLFANAVGAQTSQQPQAQSNEERAEQAVMSLDKELSLNATQKESIKKIQLKFFTKLDKAKKNFMNKQGKDKSKAVKKMQSLNDQRENAILKVLTAEQKEIYSKKIGAAKSVKKEVMSAEDEKKVKSETQK